MAQNRTRERRAGALRTRLMAAEIAYKRFHPEHRNNGDETSVENAGNALNFAGNYAKGLLHTPAGDVDPGAYGTLLQALASGDAEAFERIRLGTNPGPTRRKLTNPQAGLAFSLDGPDAQEPTLPPAPAYGGTETAAEAAEVYWMAVLRDVSFTDYATAPVAAQAASSLSSVPAGGEFTVETSPRDSSGAVTTDLLFRGSLPGDLVGPYVSQFLLQGTDGPCAPAGSLNPGQVRQDGLLGYGAQRIDQRIVSADPGQNFLLDQTSWLDSQKGRQPSQGIAPDCTPRFVRNLRDLAIHVRADRNYQHYLNAALLLQNPNHLAPAVPDRSPAGGTDPGNPYHTYGVQEGFATFGDWHLLALLAEVTTRALKAAWYQKWFVHRRLRPEEYGGRVDRRFNGGATTMPDIHGELISSFTTGQLSNHYGPGAIPPGFNTYLLPQAFPEGSPLHPAYPSGHATVAGACVTLLKAWFHDERPLTDFLPGAFVPSADGEQLVPAPSGVFPPTHLLAHELNKLASNISLGRNGAGVHWRSDYYRRHPGNLVVADPNFPIPPYANYEPYQQDAIRDLGGIALGEQIAIGLLQEQALTYNEERRDLATPGAPFGDFYFTFLDFRNRRLRVTANGVVELA